MAEEQSHPRVLDIRTPGLVDAIGSLPHLHLWEALRRLGRPASVKELSNAVGQTSASVVKALAALEEVRLVTQVRAARTKRYPAWRVTADEITVSFRPYDPLDESLRASLTGLFGASRAEEIRRMTKTVQERSPTDNQCDSLNAVYFDSADLLEFWGIVQRLERFYARCAKKAVARGAGGKGAATDHTLQHCNYHVSLCLVPLRPGVLPLPALQIVGSHVAGDVADAARKGVATSLTTREFTVASMLARGQSKTEVARALHISRHTVAEFARRIYRKLGVTRNVQLAARLAELE